jgi:hypothetical protein
VLLAATAVCIVFAAVAKLVYGAVLLPVRETYRVVANTATENISRSNMADNAIFVFITNRFI